MAVWKVSYVIIKSDLVGGIINLDHGPVPGEILEIGGHRLEVIETQELIPPRGEFHYIHTTCRLLEPKV